MLRRGGLPCHPQPPEPHGIVDGSPARRGYLDRHEAETSGPGSPRDRAAPPRGPSRSDGWPCACGRRHRRRGFALGSGPSFPGAARCRRRRRGGASCRDRDRPRSGFQDLLALAGRIRAAARVRLGGVGKPFGGRGALAGAAPLRGRRRRRLRLQGPRPAAGAREPERFGKAAAARPQARLRRLQGHLHPGEAGSPAPEIAAALARVPRPQALGAPGGLSILAIDPETVDGKPALAVAVRAPPGADLFVEGPEGWYVAAGRLQPLPAASGGADGRFLVEIFERPTDAAGERAVETAARLDTARLPR